MTPSTLTALQLSIAHHEENLKAEGPSQVRLTAKHCALCKLFNTQETLSEKQCDGCPVRDKTGLVACEGTPYENLYQAFENWEGASHAGRDTTTHKLAFLSAERAEIEFLRGLLPEDAK